MHAKYDGREEHSMWTGSRGGLSSRVVAELSPHTLSDFLGVSPRMFMVSPRLIENSVVFSRRLRL